jgi:hypothetical protein
MGSDAKNAAARAGSTGGYRRRFAESELLLPQPHALKPGVGLLQAPAVIGLEHIGDGDHQIKRAAVIAATADGTALQGVGELEKLQFSEPVALLKGSQGVVLLVGQAAHCRGAIGLSLDQRTDEGRDALKEGEQRGWREAPKGSNSSCARQRV